MVCGVLWAIYNFVPYIILKACYFDCKNSHVLGTITRFLGLYSSYFLSASFCALINLSIILTEE